MKNDVLKKLESNYEDKNNSKYEGKKLKNYTC